MSGLIAYRGVDGAIALAISERLKQFFSNAGSRPCGSRSTGCARRGKVDDPAAVLARISPSTELESGRDCELMIEAAPERFELKADLFARVDALLGPEAILASNTSSIPIGRLAARTGRPDRVCGMHFFNPVAVLPLVELIRGLDTSDETAAAVRACAEAMGKTVAESRDVPGFIANRVLLPMLNEAVFCLWRASVTRSRSTTVMRLGMAHPLGPLALADLIGLDTCLAVLEVLGTGALAIRSTGRARSGASTSMPGASAARGRGFHFYV